MEGNRERRSLSSSLALLIRDCEKRIRKFAPPGVLAVYIGPGDSYSKLTTVACDNNTGSTGSTSKVVFPVTQGTIYWIAVDGVGTQSAPFT